jgi:hypothetical protein
MWYWVFLGLRGRDRTPEEALVRGNILASYREALQEARTELAHKEKEESEDKLVWQMHTKQLAAEIKSEEQSRQRERELAEPEVWQALVHSFEAEDAAGVRKACQRSKRWLNTEWKGRDFVLLLVEKAEQFVRAKDDPFYPHAPHPSSDRKRVTFFARAMAGVSCGLSPSTAVGRLRKMKHGRECRCVNCNSQHWQQLYETIYVALDKERKKRKMARP